MAVNYMEDGTLAEPAPINAFMKSPSAIIGDGDAMVLPDMAATIFEGEAELAVVIGKRASSRETVPFSSTTPISEGVTYLQIAPTAARSRNMTR
jgi:2-keto-4-pentenoate hydratase/2-oxohepta-3-ene-1,7-dioic acid hydratase in catechol pathway